MLDNINSNNTSIKREIIASRWIKPIEAFVPLPEQTEPITYCSLNNYKKKIDQLDSKYPILAHETTESKAKNILETGFNPTNKEMCSLRDRAVFGWIFSDDIGYFRDECKSDCNCVLFFKAPKSRIYVSSYRSSAYLLGMGKIDPKQYESNYVIKLQELESIIRSNPSLLDNIGYTFENLIFDDNG
jgi:hypothetical protein